MRCGIRYILHNYQCPLFPHALGHVVPPHDRCYVARDVADVVDVESCAAYSIEYTAYSMQHTAYSIQHRERVGD
jgi:hypothetical protein